MGFDGKAIERLYFCVFQPSVVCYSTEQLFRRGVGDDGNTTDTWVLLEVMIAEVMAVIRHLHMI